MQDLKQALYLLADELRGMAAQGKRFAQNVYEAERADRIMELAARVAALVDEASAEEIHARFSDEHWLRVSPAIGVNAFLLDPDGRILLAQRRDDGRWALPGGVAEIGQTPAEAVLHELWEEAGLRGEVRRLLGIFDGRQWGLRTKVHLLAFVFLVDCADLSPVPGIEMLDARFFRPYALPDLLHPGHDALIARSIDLAQEGQTYFDPASTFGTVDLPMHQRPAD